MAKAFGKKKPTAPVDVEEVEVEEAEAEEAEAEGTGEEGDSEPIVRERKWNYGITLESKIRRVAGKECPSSVSEAWDATANGPNVERFKELAGSDWRHCLRVMARAGCIQIVTAGVTYPIPYDKEAAEEARKARAAAKAAKEAAEAEEEEVEEEEVEAPPAKKSPAKKSPAKKAAAKRK